MNDIPPIVADLVWVDALIFSVTVNKSTLTFDSDAEDGPSPIEAFCSALVGCMAIDVMHILAKGRHAVRACRAHLVGTRASENPRRLVSVTVHFTVEGEAPLDAVDRAIALSREKYCSVWHSMRQDIDFQVTVDVHA